MSKANRLGSLILILTFTLSYIKPTPAFAGTLEFDGVPVDITTVDGEDLVIVPGT